MFKSSRNNITVTKSRYKEGVDIRSQYQEVLSKIHSEFNPKSINFWGPSTSKHSKTFVTGSGKNPISQPVETTLLAPGIIDSIFVPEETIDIVINFLKNEYPQIQIDGEHQPSNSYRF